MGYVEAELMRTWADLLAYGGDTQREFVIQALRDNADAAEDREEDPD